MAPVFLWHHLLRNTLLATYSVGSADQIQASNCAWPVPKPTQLASQQVGRLYFT